MSENFLEAVKKSYWPSIMFGVLGGFSAIVTMFVNVGDKVSIKWLILLALIATFIISILLDIILRVLKSNFDYDEKPITYLIDDQIIIIRKSARYFNNAFITGFKLDDKIEKRAFIGYVFHIQEKMIQIKILKWLDEAIDTRDKSIASNLLIRPSITLAEIDLLRKDNDSNG